MKKEYKYKIYLFSSYVRMLRASRKWITNKFSPFLSRLILVHQLRQDGRMMGKFVGCVSGASCTAQGSWFQRTNLLDVLRLLKLLLGYERNGLTAGVGVAAAPATLAELHGSCRIWLIEGRGGGVTGANGLAVYAGAVIY